MKLIHQLMLVTAASVIPGHAGEPAPMPAPAPVYSNAHWFAGGGVDYLFDAEEAYINGHFGYDWGNRHSVFAEIGWVGQDADVFAPIVGGPFFPLSVDVDVIPITANYKYEVPLSNAWSFYLGGGIGAAYIDVSAAGLDNSDWSFAGQAFLGVVYNVSESFEFYTGARYLFLDDTSLAGVNVGDLDDFGAGIGIRFNF